MLGFLKGIAQRLAHKMLRSRIKFGGVFHVEHYRNGELLATYDMPNGVTDLGVNHVLDVAFHEAAATATWYLGLVDNSGFSAFANADTSASHGGWNEFTSYSESDRLAWTEGAAAARAITNAATVDFSINGSGTVKGVFLISDDTKSGTTGVLFATAAFSSNVPVLNGDDLKVTYTVSG